MYEYILYHTVVLNLHRSMLGLRSMTLNRLSMGQISRGSTKQIGPFGVSTISVVDPSSCHSMPFLPRFNESQRNSTSFTRKNNQLQQVRNMAETEMPNSAWGNGVWSVFSQVSSVFLILWSKFLDIAIITSKLLGNCGALVVINPGDELTAQLPAISCHKWSICSPW